MSRTTELLTYLVIFEFNTPKPRFSKPPFSKYHDLVNKFQLHFSYFTMKALSI